MRKNKNQNEPKLKTEASWGALIFCGVVLLLMIAAMIVIFCIK